MDGLERLLETPTLFMGAVFDRFDSIALRAVLDLSDSDASALLNSNGIEQLDPLLGIYRFQPDTYMALLQDLRQRAPQQELPLHQRAFQHFLARLRAFSPASSTAAHAYVEAACIHHLWAIHELNLDYMRWDEVAVLIAELRAAAPALAQQHASRLALLDAYNKFRSQEYEPANILVNELLQQVDLDPTLRAHGLLIRGLIAMNQAKIEYALYMFDQGLALGEQIHNQRIQANALVNQSWVYNQIQQFEKALHLSKRSLEHFRLAGDQYGAAYALYSIGNNTIYLGDWARGIGYLDQAAAIYEPAGMLGQLSLVDWARGFLFLCLGNDHASINAFERALAIVQSPDSSNTVTAADTLTELGLLYQIQERWDVAERALTQSIALTERLGDDLRRALLMHRYGNLLQRRGQADAALQMMIAAIDLLETLRITTTAEQLKIDLLGMASQVYESVALDLYERQDIAAAFTYVERARARAFLDLLALRDATADITPYRTTITLADLQSRLAADVVVLEYFTYGVQPPGGSFLSRILSANARLQDQLRVRKGILVFAITANSAQAFQINFDPNLLQPAPHDPAPGWHLITEQKLSWLYRQLITPVETLISDCRIVHIIPHGPLHYVPFAALRTRNGGMFLREDGPALAYAPSATVLCACLAMPSDTTGMDLTLGYDDHGASALRLAEREARYVARVTTGQSITGSSPKSHELLAHGPQLRRLHIASHAIYQAGDPLGSALRLGEGDEIDARTLMQTLKLGNTLVTLNACMSGLSHVASGDELLGLPRAFLFAGAATIICTLHQVDDLAAYILMVVFYENLALGMPPAEAIHQAQISLSNADHAQISLLVERTLGADGVAILATFPSMNGQDQRPFAHPRYWASFILIGKP
ncbi:MAG: CHAT domain-containing tetratricopeptide repeat protein [Roseiflexaceae bacterium]|nr:CHAT domain-containing tetratricopeptide repeat protein [Roseiflexaceae bacterium]